MLDRLLLALLGPFQDALVGMSVCNILARLAADDTGRTDIMGARTTRFPRLSACIPGLPCRPAQWLLYSCLSSCSAAARIVIRHSQTY